MPVEALGEEVVISLSSIQFHPEEIAVAHDLLARAWSELTDKLSEKQVHVFRLHIYYGIGYKEIAHLLSLEESSVKVYISLGMRKIRKILLRLREEI